MSLAISDLEKFVRTNVLAIPEVSAVVVDRAYNYAPGGNAQFPCVRFNVVPLKSSFGQLLETVMNYFLVDIEVVTRNGYTSDTDAAANAINERFKLIRREIAGEYRVSIRHDTPISRRTSGATEEEFFYHRGFTFKAELAPSAEYQ